MMNNTKNRLAPFWLAVVGAVVATAVYVYVYHVKPFAPLWNNLFLDFAPAVVAGLGAAVATWIWRQFDPADRPRTVWRYFALGLWAWTIADATWLLYPLLSDVEVPSLSPPNVCWVAGYGFFAAALVHQGRLIFRPKRGQERRVVSGVVLAVLLASLVGTIVQEQLVGSKGDWLGMFLNAFYPIGDLGLALVAWALARAFGWGLWARPWQALFAFAIADALYSWTWTAGLYSSVPGAQGYIVSLLADTLYLVAYLVLALACYSQLLLLKLGPRFGRQQG